jgi:hypothetical protein
MNLSPQAILKAVVTTMTARTTELKGTISIAKDPEDMIRQLTVSPSTFRAIFMWPGYAPNANAAHGVTTDRLEVVIQVAAGLHVDESQYLTTSRPGATPSLMELISDYEQRIRALRFPTDAGIDPTGYTLQNSEYLLIEGIVTTQHQLSFTLERALKSHPTVIPVTIP